MRSKLSVSDSRDGCAFGGADAGADVGACAGVPGGAQIWGHFLESVKAGPQLALVLAVCPQMPQCPPVGFAGRCPAAVASKCGSSNQRDAVEIVLIHQDAVAVG